MLDFPWWEEDLAGKVLDKDVVHTKDSYVSCSIWVLYCDCSTRDLSS